MKNKQAMGFKHVNPDPHVLSCLKQLNGSNPADVFLSWCFSAVAACSACFVFFITLVLQDIWTIKVVTTLENTFRDHMIPLF